MIKRYNCFSEDLIEHALSEGVEQTKDGILYFPTGKFTGRSPKDRYFCEGEYVKRVIDTTREINQLVSRKTYQSLRTMIEDHLQNAPIFYRTSRALCHNEKYVSLFELNTTYAWANLFFNNMTNNSVEYSRQPNEFYTN